MARRWTKKRSGELLYFLYFVIHCFLLFESIIVFTYFNRIGEDYFFMVPMQIFTILVFVRGFVTALHLYGYYRRKNLNKDGEVKEYSPIYYHMFLDKLYLAQFL